MGKRLVVLGLDGAEWDVLDPLIAEGTLPNFSRMKEEGSHARLLSTIPITTATAWRSIFTGVNPGKHGVFDFFRFDGDGIKLTYSTDNKVPYFWELMEEKRFIAVNIPCTYPPKEMPNTLLVTGMGTPSTKNRFTNSPELSEELLRVVPDLEFSSVAGQLAVGSLPIPKDKLKESLLKNLERTKKLHLHMLESKEWDAAFIVFSETDWAQHFFMSDFVRLEKKSDSPIAQVYMEIDAFLGHLMEKGYDIMIVSDHGFREITRTLYINTFLREKGLIRLKEEPLRKRFFRKLGIYREDAMARFPFEAFRFMKPISVSYKLGSILPGRRPKVTDIDHKNSIAFLLSQSGGGVFVKSPEDVERLAKLLEGLEDGGRKAIRAVLRKQDIYSGDELETAPDLLVLPHDGILITDKLDANVFQDIDPSKEKSGTHRIFGVFMSHGSNLHGKGRLDDLSVVDIASTVLPYFSYRNPGFFDGKTIPILKESKQELEPSQKLVLGNIKQKLSKSG
jgi:predicted AlkP superfamily phosphohydrolase/phosphomutase